MQNSTNFSKIHVVIDNSPNEVHNPAIAIDNNDRIYIVWENLDGNQSEILIANSTDYFLANYKISLNSTHNDSYPDIAIDSLGTIHIVWSAPSNTSGPLESDIYYTNSTDGFSTYKIISKNTYNDTTANIAVDSNNTIHIAWAGSNGSIYNIYYANSTDNFNSNKTVSNNPWNDEFPDITVSDLSVIISWSQSNSTQYDIAIAENTTNFINRIISQNPYDDLNARIVNGPGDIFHIVWSSFDINETKILYSNSLSNYSKIDTISINNATNSQCDIQIDKIGRVRVTWIAMNTTFYSYSLHPPPIIANCFYYNPHFLAPQYGIYLYVSIIDYFTPEYVNVLFSYDRDAWHQDKIVGSGNSNSWSGLYRIYHYSYGSFLFYKFLITDKTGLSFITQEKVLYLQKIEHKNANFILILLGILGIITIFFMIPQIRRRLDKIFKIENQNDKLKKI